MWSTVWFPHLLPRSYLLHCQWKEKKGCHVLCWVGISLIYYVCNVESFKLQIIFFSFKKHGTSFSKILTWRYIPTTSLLHKYFLLETSVSLFYWNNLPWSRNQVPRQHLKPEYELNVQKISFRLLCMYLLKFYKAQLEFSIYGSNIPQGKEKRNIY